MCGINGFTWQDGALIQAMNDVTKYRGPDDRGIYVDENISLGHTRLSIIDLSSDGHQPMSNEDDTIWITYNGEIYNFQEIRENLPKAGHFFKSKTDTEVIIHAYEMYGLNCMNKFNGMWAFGIYDKNEETLILSRDRYGIKPLYYYVDEERLTFSSMITGILSHQIEIVPNDRAIMEYLAFNLEQHDTYTFFENVNSLAPGHLLIYNLKTKKHRVQRWYTPESREIKNSDTLKNYFTNSVKLRAISDVPVGVCLSGGIDSTAITCTLDKYFTNTFNTYSLIVP
ncbi:asparagine synthase (glutamine-hydrolyzing), partial [Chloroflexota bacterium]